MRQRTLRYAVYCFSNLIKSLTSWVCLLGAGSILNLYSNTLWLVSGSLPDTLSNILLWLAGGTIILSSASLENSMNSNTLWWILGTLLLLAFSAMSLFVFYVLFELSLVPILLMILSAGSQPERLSSGSYLLFYTTVISIPYLTMILLISGPGIKMWSSASIMTSSSFSLLAILPFLVKMPVLGVHFWLPKAHVEASTTGSMLLAGLLLKLGSYGAFRISAVFFLSSALFLFQGVWLIAAVVSSVMTTMQSDIKKLIAYSSVTHMSFMVVAVACLNKTGMLSLSLLSLAHAWAAMAMFNTGGTLSHSVKSRALYLMSSQKSLDWLIVLLGVVLVSNASVPPMPSFFPELAMLMSVKSSNFLMSAVFLLLSLGVCYYNAFLFFSLSHMKPWSSAPGKWETLFGVSVAGLLLVNVFSLLWLSHF